MRRRAFIAGSAAAAALARPFAVRAQPAAMPVIGYLHPGSPEAERRQVAAFWRALNNAGYIEGKNVAIEYRWAEGHFDKVPALLAELIERRVAVIVAGGGTAPAAKAAATSIPVVFTSGVDPLLQGLVASLSRPGGTMAGVAFFANDILPKQMELLLEVAPASAVVGFVNDAGYPYAAARIAELEAAIHERGRKLVVHNVANRAEIGAAFDALGRQGVGAIIVSADPLFTEWRDDLVAAAARRAWPACYGLREFTEAGGLMSYGSDLADTYHQVGVYVARILDGTQPADLPVIQAEKIELVLNQATAKGLGIAFPLPLLARADEVIE